MDGRLLPILLLLALLPACASWPEEGSAADSRGQGGSLLNWPGPVVDSSEVRRSGALRWPDGPEDAGPPGDNGASVFSTDILQAAVSARGRPYRLGANGPNAFDCSGLVQYAHRRAGINVPRTTRRQFRAARPVHRDNLQEGDVIFFAVDSISISHVGLYAGEGRFIHSPSPGKTVSWARLDNNYWASRFAGAGRFH